MANSTDAFFLSVVIPMYREAKRIGPTLTDVLAWLSAQPFASEVVLVDDGSPDNTVDVVTPALGDHAGRVQVRLVRHEVNRGKGGAVRTGLASSRGRYALMMDADSAARIDQVTRLFARLTPRTGIAAGSREADDAQVKAAFGRRITGFVFRLCLHALGLAIIRDTQCGFKLYTRPAIDVINRYATSDGYTFDLEHLKLCRLAGLDVVERGVAWVHVEGGQVSAVSDGLKMLAQAWKLRSCLKTLQVEPAPTADGASLPASFVEVKPAPSASAA